jgi:HupE / UreJ protein
MTSFPTRTRRLPVFLAGLLCAGAAHAHKSSDAYLTWRVEGHRIEQRLDIALRDLDRDLALDADEDGQLTWGEVRGRWAEIARVGAEGVRVTADGQPCIAASADVPPQLDEHTDGRYAVLQQTFECSALVRRIGVDYRLFAASDPTHRGIARLTTSGDGGATEHGAVLVPGAAPQSFALEPAAGTAAQSFAGFVSEGLHHIAIGLDHVLFLVTLLMVAVWRRDEAGAGWAPRQSAASAWKEALRLVSAFTVAHSLTLGLAATGVLAPPSRWIESLIAVSVLVAAIDNVRPFLRGPRWAMVSVFGLVHGFGFAGPLQDLGLREGALALPLLGFNLGVELGQLALVAVLLPLACLWRDRVFYRRVVVPGGSAVIAALASVWMLERSLQLSLLP